MDIYIYIWVYLYDFRFKCTFKPLIRAGLK